MNFEKGMYFRIADAGLVAAKSTRAAMMAQYPDGYHESKAVMLNQGELFGVDKDGDVSVAYTKDSCKFFGFTTDITDELKALGPIDQQT